MFKVEYTTTLLDHHMVAVGDLVDGKMVVDAETPQDAETKVRDALEEGFPRETEIDSVTELKKFSVRCRSWSIDHHGIPIPGTSRTIFITVEAEDKESAEKEVETAALSGPMQEQETSAMEISA
ncbi:MAG: hypothetical protein ISS48_00335 [Candidatus Aenigmarchaeota archaeon]|nr:hypothetical protein [Candidatus Aenigmarchaeota archaeon]